MRDAVRDIISGWMVIDDFDDLTDRIERAGEWTTINGPLQDDEEATITLMIQSQIARGIMRGDFDFAIGPRLALCKNRQTRVRGDGGCLACDADAGESCRLRRELVDVVAAEGRKPDRASAGVGRPAGAPAGAAGGAAREETP
jgi:hypothetical protein